MIRPWQQGPSEVLAEGFGKEMRKVTFTDPMGKEHEYFLFGHPHSVDVLPVTREGMVVAVRQFKQGADRIILALPGGLIDPGEDALSAAERELLEETGYTAGTVIPLGGPLFIAPRSSWTTFSPFLALDCERAGEQELDRGEDIEIVLIPVQDWMRISETTLEMSSSIAVATRARPYLAERGLI